MAVDTEIQSSNTADQPIAEAVQTIVIDNKEVPITEAQRAYDTMASSLRADYTRKTTEASNEKKKNAQLLKEDLDWFNSNDQRLWGMYSPKIDGGTGYMGTEAQRLQFNNDDGVEPTVQRTNDKRAFEVNPEIKVMRDRLAELESKQNIIEETTFISEKDRVLSTKDVLLKTYPNASDRSVVKELGLFFLENRRHPQKHEIENIVKSIHDDTSKIIARNQKGKQETGVPTGLTTTTPAVKGTAPSTDTTKKTLTFDSDQDGITKRIFGRLTGG